MLNWSTENHSFSVKYRRNALEAVESFLNNPLEAAKNNLPIEWLLMRRQSILQELLVIQLAEFDRER